MAEKPFPINVRAIIDVIARDLSIAAKTDAAPANLSELLPNVGKKLKQARASLTTVATGLREQRHEALEQRHTAILAMRPSPPSISDLVEAREAKLRRAGANSAVVAGRVVDEHNGSGIPGLLVRLSAGDDAVEARSDALGFYRIVRPAKAVDTRIEIRNEEDAVIHSADVTLAPGEVVVRNAEIHPSKVAAGLERAGLVAEHVTRDRQRWELNTNVRNSRLALRLPRRQRAAAATAPSDADD